jgi:hypothetical protein
MSHRLSLCPTSSPVIRFAMTSMGANITHDERQWVVVENPE